MAFLSPSESIGGHDVANPEAVFVVGQPGRDERHGHDGTESLAEFLDRCARSAVECGRPHEG